MATRRAKATVEIIANKTKTKATEIKFKKSSFLDSKVYNKDLVSALLDDNKEYTKDEVDKLIDDFRKGKVN